MSSLFSFLHSPKERRPLVRPPSATRAGAWPQRLPILDLAWRPSCLALPSNGRRAYVRNDIVWSLMETLMLYKAGDGSRPLSHKAATVSLLMTQLYASLKPGERRWAEGAAAAPTPASPNKTTARPS